MPSSSLAPPRQPTSQLAASPLIVPAPVPPQISVATPSSPRTGEQISTVQVVSAPVKSLVSASLAVPIDASAISPALRAWVECLVDTRVEQEGRDVLVHVARKESVATQATVQQTIQQSEQQWQRLETQVRSLAEAHHGLLAVVEGFGGGAERSQNSDTRARTETLSTVERLMSTVGELHQTVEHETDGTRAALEEIQRTERMLIQEVRQQDSAIEELQRGHRTMGDEAQRVRSFLAELQRLQEEVGQRQWHCSEELATSSEAISAARQEMGDLTQVVQRLELRLNTWRAEIVAELAEEVREQASLREEERAEERQHLEQLQREAQQSAGQRIDLEARLEALRVEIASAPRQADLELRQNLQLLARRAEEYEARLEGRLESLRSELQVVMPEKLQVVSGRVDALQQAATKDIEAAQQGLEDLMHLVQRLDQCFGAFRAEVAKELDAAQSVASEGTAEAESRLQQLRDGLLSHESAHKELREELIVEVREGRDEVESWQGNFREEVETLQRKLAADIRGEVRALLKTDQNAIAMLDEQLWLTDQRLGQRIDELVQSIGRGGRASTLATTVETSAAVPPRFSGPRLRIPADEHTAKG